ncbi:sensor histidine kinase [Brachybacterium sp. GCM10030267]|uniref:sensor histidine kinase n=1 Tax=Brachybacterium sp. GCM10030267 TaxID=3273381 RepID=UPI003624569A
MDTDGRADAASGPAAGRCPDLPGPRGGRWRRFGPWLVLAWPPLLLGAFLVVAVQERRWLDLALMLALCTSFAAAMIVVLRPSRARRRRLTPVLLLALEGVLAGAILLTGTSADGPGLAFATLPLVAITASVVLPPDTGPAAIALITVVTVAVAMLARVDAGVVAGLAVTTLLSGMGSYVVHRLAATVTELDRTRRELAEAAVAAERLRFSRDLHDLLGHTLSVIVVKAEAVRRLAEADPASATAHGADIESLGRTALAEVRDAVAGYRDGGLEDELTRAGAALRAAGIRVRIDPPPPGLDQDSQAVLVWVIREGVTNVVRHARAQHCHIVAAVDANATQLVVADDGPGTSRPFRAGAGLRGLRERIDEHGGTLTAGPTDDGFRLEATLPVSAAWAASPHDRKSSSP